ncbi:MAG: V-type ATP synthase subunit I, partial [Oscillospiraceae bacterium]|nr:V-type ATP synthase subunit I [Oscillospiraceae bacterium]
MAKLNMKRVEIAGPQRERKQIMETLQRRGVLELTGCEGEGLLRLETAGSVAEFEKARGEAEAARRALAEALPAKKKPLLSSFSPGTRAMAGADFDERAARAEGTLETCRRVNRLRAAAAAARAEIARARAQVDQLRPWEALDIPMDFRGTACAAVFIGSVPYRCGAGELAETLACDSAEIEVVAAFAERSNVFVACHRRDEDRVGRALRDIGFAQAGDPPHCPPAEQLALHGKEIARLRGEIAAAEEEIRGCAGMEGEIEFLIDCYAVRADKYEALGSLGLTGSAFVARGYIPEKYLRRVTAELEKKYTVAIEVSAPGEDEDVPVLLENNGFAAPVEGITEMYAVPARDDIDPNPVMAFFYYFFFGMMLSDAGYGLLLTLGCAVALKKFSLTKKMRGNLKMFLYCGISTIFWGALFGSWFGDIVQVVCTQFLGRPAPRLYLWMDPVADPMKLLLICFALGIAHLFAGVVNTMGAMPRNPVDQGIM